MERRVEDFIFRGTDEEAIVHIIDYYGEGIKRLIFTYVKNYAQTDDLFQDFLLKVYQNIGQFHGNSSLKTWLYRIAINTCKDYLRSPINRIFSPGIKSDLIKTSQSAETQVLKKEYYQQLAQCIFSLPIKYREIFVLRFYQDFTIKEISEAVGIPESTVRTRIMRGKEKIKEQLGGDGFDEFE